MKSDVPEFIAETWVVEPKAWPHAEEDLRRAAVQYLQAYVRDYRDELMQVSNSEKTFSFGLANQVLQGKIDLIRSTGQDGCEIVDFKTSKPRPEGMERDAFQLALYALGVEESLHLPVSSLTVHFIGKKQQVVQWAWSDERKLEASERLTAILTCIEQGKYEPDLSYCRLCKEFRAICPYTHEQSVEEMDERL